MRPACFVGISYGVGFLRLGYIPNQIPRSVSLRQIISVVGAKSRGYGLINSFFPPVDLNSNSNLDYRLLASKFDPLPRVVRSTAERSKRVQNSQYAGAKGKTVETYNKPRCNFQYYEW